MKTVTIISPADWLEEELLEKGKTALAALGFAVKIHPQCYERFGRMAGMDSLRAAALHDCLADDTDIIWAAKGGYGAIRILDKIDYDLWRKNPKPVVGYSDITALAQAAYACAGVQGRIGPMVREIAKERHPACTAALARDLQSNAPSLSGLVDGAVALNAGVAEGVLAGGTLSCIASLVGTPFDLPDDRNYILMIEDICETNYRLDRFLRQIRYSRWGKTSGR